MNAAGPNYATASLYVGDLHPEVTEAMLFEKFSAAGAIESVRVCRDTESKRSLGYAYVNFQQPADAEKALNTMNFDAMKGSPIRISWPQRDPTLQRSGLGNVFIENLDKSIDNKAMYDTFSAFGNILSCKVLTDENGENRGYGFVHFETEESALKAIKKVNGMLLNGRKVFVGRFLPSRESSSGTGDHARKFTNVYIKNFGVELEEDDLRKICETYGKILSVKIMTDTEGNSRGFGFVSFESHEAAAVCVEDLNGKEYGGRQLFAGRAQKKSERSAELRARFDEIRQERSSRFQGTNLYIKHLDDDIDDERLRKEFSRFGNIISAKVMTNSKEVSMGFGFVCFSSQEEATKAMTEMNDRIISVKKLYVSLAQRKEVRQAQLATQYMRMNMNYRVPGQQMSQIYPGFNTYYPTMPPQRNLYTGQLAQVRNPRWPTAQKRPTYQNGYQINEALSVLADNQQKTQKNVPAATVERRVPADHPMCIDGDTVTQKSSTSESNDKITETARRSPKNERGKRQKSSVSVQATQTAEIFTPIEQTAQIATIRLEMQEILEVTESLKDKVNAVSSVLADSQHNEQNTV